MSKTPKIIILFECLVTVSLTKGIEKVHQLKLFFQKRKRKNNMKIQQFLILGCFLGSLNCLASASKIKTGLSKIKTNGKWFVDENNRVMMFHGFNAVEKQFPWVPVDGNNVNLKNLSQLQDFKNWGFNAVRLGFMWSGLYPQKGVVNQTYVNEMVAIIKSLEDYGLYVMIDLHQDMLSSKFNSYDGAPLWALNELPPPEHSFPWPFNKTNLGFGAYLTDAACHAFQCIYSNVSNFETYFQQYWTTTAQILKDTNSVLGYELINEPWVIFRHKIDLR
jgi:endoglycosylceramidase